MFTCEGTRRINGRSDRAKSSGFCSDRASGIFSCNSSERRVERSSPWVFLECTSTFCSSFLFSTCQSRSASLKGCAGCFGLSRLETELSKASLRSPCSEITPSPNCCICTANHSTSAISSSVRFNPKPRAATTLSIIDPPHSIDTSRVHQSTFRDRPLPN